MNAAARLVATALADIPEVRTGDDLGAHVATGLDTSGIRLEPGDILVLAQKIVSKAEDRCVDLSTVTASSRAQELARRVEKDPRLVELILQESTEVLRAVPGVLIVAHRLGFVMANAGIDQSNVAGADHALMLPLDPDGSCDTIRQSLRARTGCDVGVVIIDSLGRAWRNGTVGHAIGVSGLAALLDMRGRPDRGGRPLQTSELGLADEVAAAASLLMGQADEGTPVVHLRGVPYRRREARITELLRLPEKDLFR